VKDAGTSKDTDNEPWSQIEAVDNMYNNISATRVAHILKREILGITEARILELKEIMQSFTMCKLPEPRDQIHLYYPFCENEKRTLIYYVIRKMESSL